MANRDHSLDDGIIQAAYSSFLLTAFRKPLCTRSPKKRCYYGGNLHKIQE